MRTALINSNVLGILAAIGAAVAFSVIDVTFKFLSDGYPLYQVVFFRSVVALALLLAIIIPLEGGYRILRTRNTRLHLMRVAAVAFANISFFSGLAVLPLAEAVAIAFATPLIVTILSVLFLKERVGPWRWGAVIVGFSGILVIVKPGMDAFQPYALLPFFGSCGYATLHILTRRAGGSDKAATLSFYPTLGFLIISALAGLIFGHGNWATGAPLTDVVLKPWAWPDGFEWGIFAVAGVSGAIGGYLVGQAYRMCEAGLVAPFEYIAMPLAVVWGVLVFAEWPDQSVWLGSALIIGAGLVSLWRETRTPGPPPRPRPRSSG
ncbi:DMT family transporter [Tritonibacter scottomollicae]|uniref:EamA domain-containing membrane protein RarD n=1 Tax=Tritonibacter scottomollicae TaxID=483013 RepID=A0A2T1ADG6_TRISK|nr:DMT family transporter [Tritonibacter scottomollicae]PRZ46621.1 EamA domain-containing membrane protein RarD [Tritonibacter scottomollicae]